MISWHRRLCPQKRSPFIPPRMRDNDWRVGVDAFSHPTPQKHLSFSTPSRSHCKQQKSPRWDQGFFSPLKTICIQQPWIKVSIELKLPTIQQVSSPHQQRLDHILSSMPTALESQSSLERVWSIRSIIKKNKRQLRHSFLFLPKTSKMTILNLEFWNTVINSCSCCNPNENVS